MKTFDNYMVMNNLACIDTKNINDESIEYTTNDLIKKIKFMHQNISNIMLLHDEIDDYSVLMDCSILCTKDMHKKYEMDGCLEKLEIDKNILKNLIYVKIPSDYFYAGCSGNFYTRSTNLLNYDIEGLVNYEKFFSELDKLGIECSGFFGTADKADFENFALSILKDYPVFCLKDKEKSKNKILEKK